VGWPSGGKAGGGWNDGGAGCAVDGVGATRLVSRRSSCSGEGSSDRFYVSTTSNKRVLKPSDN
jgi:hypothetical protein